ncbi:hypothetical protein H839_08174 [Parageobacillus genomosp. 1]|uniref:Cytoplasmic protein n=1 Tax=Parageobacillus genomosp. 1 TaxID=1295642 RepID=A0ABC9VGG0_9BACL|nr:hypothetical protein [Parageobacillus genomosp. 1]EZP77594.1 hypothetical protein H839_08174 [Parageobacillus genomosp. 1]
MNQTTIFDFLEGEKPDEQLMERFAKLFPEWEVLGYVKDWEWGKSDDYKLVIHRDGIYKWVRVELYHDGRSCAGYTQRTDFEPHWFEWYEQHKRHWVWRSLEDRNRVYEIAMKNRHS